jgi:hypothetical protein
MKTFYNIKVIHLLDSSKNDHMFIDPKNNSLYSLVEKFLNLRKLLI